jgi:hypothetical protein
MNRFELAGVLGHFSMTVSPFDARSIGYAAKEFSFEARAFQIFRKRYGFRLQWTILVRNLRKTESRDR